MTFIDAILEGDNTETLKKLPDKSLDCCITSPPYFMQRRYSDSDAEIGGEDFPMEYANRICDVFDEVKRVLKDEGSLWLNLGDTYAGSGKGGAKSGEGKQGYLKGEVDSRLFKSKRYPPKSLIGIPWLVAFAMQDRGWILREDIVWCLSGGTYVYIRTKSGVYTCMLRELCKYPQGSVELWNGTKWTQVLGIGKSVVVDDKYSLTLRSGERINCTGGHEWPLSDGRIRKTSALKKGDRLLSCNLPDVLVSTPNFLTDNTLWLIGLYLAEGCKNRIHRNQKSLSFSLNADEISWIDKMRDVVSNLGGDLSYVIKGNNLTVRCSGKVVVALIDQYISGSSSHDKRFTSKVWNLPNAAIKKIMQGYFDGDGHYDGNRIRVGFTRNYYLERDLRIAASRLGAVLTLKTCFSHTLGKSYPSFRGEWRWGEDVNRVQGGNEIIDICKSNSGDFFDVSVADDPHLFALASGTLTHNCKPSPLPEPCTDRFVRSHEFIFLFVKRPKYYFNHSAALEPAAGYGGWKDTAYKIADYDKTVFGIEKKERERWSQRGYASKEGAQDLMGRSPQHHGSAIKPRYFGKAGYADGNDAGGPSVEIPLRTRRDVWTIASEPSREGHYAMYPQKLVLQCLLCGCPEGGVVLDPFLGSGTTAIVAKKNNRHFVGCELNPEYVKMARRRLDDVSPLFGDA